MPINPANAQTAGAKAGSFDYGSLVAKSAGDPFHLLSPVVQRKIALRTSSTSSELGLRSPFLADCRPIPDVNQVLLALMGVLLDFGERGCVSRRVGFLTPSLLVG
jgi:hypothetical protein